MRYIHLVHLDASNFDRMTLEERQDVDRRALAKNAEFEERGILVHTEAVQDGSSRLPTVPISRPRSRWPATC